MPSKIFERPFWFLFAVLLVSSCFIYWPNLKMGFVLDDHYVIAQNPVIKNASLYPKIFSAGLFDAAHRDTSSKLNYYRPVVLSSFAFGYQWWGLNPFAERIVNVILHALNSALVFLLFLLLFKKPDRAALGALIFCVLPVHEWTVRYITGRGDLLQAFFSLTSLIVLISFLKEKRRAYIWLSAFLFVMALLSREVAVLNVFYVFLITFYVTRQFKQAIKTFLFFAIIAASYYVLRQQLVSINVGIVDITAVMAGIKLGAGYVLRLFMPYFAMQAVPCGVLTATFGIVVLCILLVVQLSRPSKQEDLPAAWFGFFWIMIGASQFVITQKIIGRLGPVLSEHFLYFESIGFVLLVALILEGVENSFLRRAMFTFFITYYVSIAIVGGLSWDSEENLLRHTQKIEGHAMTVAHEQLVMRFDDNPMAVERLIEHSSTSTNKSLWFKRLGNIYHKRRDYPHAIAGLQKAIELSPDNVEALNELGAAYLELGDKERGLDCFVKALKVDPRNADTYRILGIAFYREGDFGQAIETLKRAHVYNPDQVETSLHLMMAYYFLGDQRAYVNTIDEVSRRSSDDQVTLRFAAQELFNHGRFLDAVKILLPTKQLFANDPQTLNLLAEAQRRVESLPK